MNKRTLFLIAFAGAGAVLGAMFLGPIGGAAGAAAGALMSSKRA